MSIRLDLGEVFGEDDLELAGHAARRLGDPALPSPTLLSRTLSGELPIGRDDLAFTVEGEATIDVFNAASDNDPAGLFAAPPQEGARHQPLKLDAPIHFEEGSAWVAYRTSARATGAGTLADAKLGLSGAAEAEGEAFVRFHDYRRHRADALTGPAVATDLAGARFVVFPEHVRSLAPGEALALEAAGTLGASVSLKWSDIFTSHIGVLGRLLASGEDLEIKVRDSLRVTLRVEIQDRFLVVFSRRMPDGSRPGVDEHGGTADGSDGASGEAGETRAGQSDGAARETGGAAGHSERTGRAIEVAVRKTDRKEAGGGASAGVSVGLARPAEAEKAIRATLEALLGEPLAQVRELVDRPTVADLDPLERAALERLVDRLRIEGERLSLPRLRKKIEALEAEVSALLEKVARQKVRLAVEFDYSHTRTEESLIEMTLDEAVLGKDFGTLHRALLAGDLERVLEGAAPAAQADGADAKAPGPEHDPAHAHGEAAQAGRTGVTLRRFLRQNTAKTIRSWGVSLDFGDLFSVGGKARSYLRETVRRDRLAARSRFSFTSIESYAGKWGRDRCEWKTTLTATPRKWTPGDTPTADTLSYELHLLMQFEERRLTPNEVDRLVDLGLLWRAVTPGGAPAARERLEALGAAHRDVEVAFHLRFRNRTFPALLPLLASGSAAGLGAALGRAAPWLAAEPGRETPLVREVLYGSLWRQYLENASVSPGDLARAASQAARRAGHAGLAGLERRRRLWWTLGQLAEKNPDTRGRWSDMARGAERLRHAVERGAPHTEVGQAARLMRRGWEHAFHVRALGAFLTEALRTDPSAWPHVNRSIRVEYGTGTGRTVLNLSST